MSATLSERIACSPRTHAFPVGKGPHIVVVEDEPAILDLISKVLVMNDYRVTACSNGEEALARLRDIDDAAVVLTDLRMPGMDGLSLMRALKQRDFDGPIIAMSGGQAPTDHERAELRTSCAAFLPKPFAPRTLLTVLSQALRSPDSV